MVNGRLPGGLGAEEIYEWFAANQAGAERCLLFTFSNEANLSTREFLRKNNITSLTKPFEVGDLIGRVRSLLQTAKLVTTNESKADAASASV